MSYEEIFADMLLAERIEVTRVAIEFLLMHPDPCEGDIDRLRRINRAAYEIVTQWMVDEARERQCATQAKIT